MAHNIVTSDENRATLNRKGTIAAVKALGMSCKWNGDEYRVNFVGGKEATAYYTDDSQDAVDTAKAMRDAENARFATRLNGQATTVFLQLVDLPVKGNK